MTTYTCPYCEGNTDDYSEHVTRNINDKPEMPVFYVTGWQDSPTCGHAHALRFERNQSSGRIKSRTQYRFGVVGDRICWACDLVMPHSICRIPPC